MRILHIDTGLQMRGGQRQALLTVQLLQAAGHECTLLAKQPGLLWAAAVGAGLNVEDLSRVKVWRRSKQFDLVHAHDAGAHTIAAIASRRPFVVSRRVAFPVGRSLASRWKYRRAAGYLAVSQFVANQLKTAGIEASKIAVVHDAVQPVTPADPWSPEYRAVALASRDAQKGRDLVESAAKVSGVDVLYSDDLQRDLRRASMFVYITRSEGLGSAVLLAMQMGVPVIASKTGGLAEVFSDGVSGLYVENEVGDLVKAMRRILANRPLAHNLVRAAKERIKESFTTEHLLEGTLAAYKRALG